MKRIKDSDKFVTANFEELVEKYGHQYIAISNGDIFTGKDALEQAEAKYPQTLPLYMLVPSPKFLSSHFLL